MVTTEITGCLGTQLFQVFNLISYGLTNKEYFYFEHIDSIDVPFYWDNFLLSLKPFVKTSYEVNLHIYIEPDLPYAELPPYNKMGHPFKFYGYYNSYKYFQEKEQDIFKLINLNNQRELIKLKYTSICDFKSTVSLHFHMGDYKPDTICYYKYALQYTIDHTCKTDWNILYFFDKRDADMVKEFIGLLQDAFNHITFTPINTEIVDYEQVLLMSLCQHNIIANSIFGWWGAYFNQTPNKVITYPGRLNDASLGKKKMIDMYPDTWINIYDIMETNVLDVNIYSLHYLLPNNRLLKDPDFKTYFSNLKYDYYILPTNHICVHILDSIHYNIVSCNVDFSLYDKYIKLTYQPEHSVETFKNLITNFDITKMENIKVYNKIIENEKKIIIRDGCHRLSILLFNKYHNINKYISIS